MDQEPIVLIIGGGLAGLALAQVLEKIGLRSRVYERDANPESRGTNWAVSLQSCLPDLHAMLPDNLGTMSVASTIRTSGLKDIIAIEDAATGQIEFKFGEGIEDWDDGFLLWANRPRLRKYLLPGVDIVWNKKFDHYTEDANGILAHFSDGSVERGKVLVGADGAGSHVRSQLLRDIPGSHAAPLPYGVIGAEFILNVKEMEEFHKTATSLITSLTEQMLLFIGIRDMLEDGSASAYYHIYWADQSAADQYKNYWTQTATREELHDRALSLVKNLAGYGKTIVERIGAGSMMHPPFMLSSFQPPDELPAGRVTLMGDAVHTMPPYRGAGANTALQDAMDLAKLFEEHAEQIKSSPTFNFTALFKEYESKIIPRAQAIVKESVSALEPDANGLGAAQKMVKVLTQRAHIGEGRARSRAVHRDWMI